MFLKAGVNKTTSLTVPLLGGQCPGGHYVYDGTRKAMAEATAEHTCYVEVEGAEGFQGMVPWGDPRSSVLGDRDE